MGFLRAVIDYEDSKYKAVLHYSWMVIGERKDEYYLNSSMTDEKGKLIVEKLKI